MLKSNDRARSQVRGVSQWLPPDVAIALLDLAVQGTQPAAEAEAPARAADPARDIGWAAA
jgi:hypothetical protein